MCEELCHLEVKIINESDETKTLSLSINASVALDNAMEHMAPDTLYHLRPGHPAIDAVCLLRDRDGKNYLFLIQISLSTYAQHRSKAVDVWKKPESFEQVVIQASSIVEYYSLLAQRHIHSVELVAYVYASPQQLNSPELHLSTVFNQAISSRTTRSPSLSAHHPSCWYGLINSGTEAARIMTELSVM